MILGTFVVLLAQVLTLAIIIRAVLSWFPPSRTLAPVSAVITEATDPVLRPIRRHVRPLGGIDLSPLIALLLISVVETLLLGLLGGH